MEAQPDTLDWLLDPADPAVRYLSLRDLCDLPADDPQLLSARATAHRSGPIPEILSKMDPQGFWSEPGPGYNPKYFSTVWSLITLAQLGAHISDDARIGTACTYLLDHALTKTGQFTITGAPSGTIDCLQGNLCAALLELGFSDPRLSTAFEWMADTVTGAGIAPLEEKDAQRRYYAGKCGPEFACGANNKLPCAWGAVKVLLAFSQLPPEGRTSQVQKAIDAGICFLFSVDPSTAAYPCGYTGKPSQSWWKFGFPVFYVTDILQVAEVLVKYGYGKDPRLSKALELVRSKQDSSGRWCMEYDLTGKIWIDFGPKRQPNKYVTLRALRVLKAG